MPETIEELVEDICGMALAPLNKQIEPLEEAGDLREFLDILNPYKMYNAIVDGVNSMMSKYGRFTSSETDEGIKRIVTELEDHAHQLRSVWDALDEYDRNAIWNALGEGLTSDETLFGAAIGTVILPGLGTAIGAFFGGRSAGKRVERQVKEAVEMYSAGASNYAKIYFEYIKSITQAILSDISNIMDAIAEEEAKEAKPLLVEGSKTSASSGDIVGDLNKLCTLKQQGEITEEEFKLLKAKIIGCA